MKNTTPSDSAFAVWLILLAKVDNHLLGGLVPHCCALMHQS